MTDTQVKVGLPIDPRIQARLLEVRRDGGRRKRQLLGVAAVTTALVLLAWGLGRSPLLAVHRVDVRDTGPTTRDAVLAASGLDHHRQMLDLSPGAVRHRVEALPWVDRAVVRRHWPSTVEIDLTWRAPVAQLPGPDGKPAVLDARGRILAVGQEAATVLARPGTHLPGLVGVAPAGSPGTVLAAGWHPALVFVTAVSAVTAALPTAAGTSPPAAPRPTSPPGGVAVEAVEAVTIGPGGIWTVLLTSGISVVFGSPDQLDSKLVALRTVLLRVPLAGVATIDVRVPDTPVLTRGIRPTIVSTIPRG